MPIVFETPYSRIYNIIIVYMFRHETGTCYGDSVTSVIYDRSYGLTFVVLQITQKKGNNDFVGVWAERNKSIWAKSCIQTT